MSNFKNKTTSKPKQPSTNTQAEWDRRLFDFSNILAVFDLTEEDLIKPTAGQPASKTTTTTILNHNNQE
jgi:hypothetical protein